MKKALKEKAPFFIGLCICSIIVDVIQKDFTFDNAVLRIIVYFCCYLLFSYIEYLNSKKKG